jgi:prevent-host-death family protein
VRVASNKEIEPLETFVQACDATSDRLRGIRRSLRRLVETHVSPNNYDIRGLTLDDLATGWRRQQVSRALGLLGQPSMTRIMVMETLPLATVKAQLSTLVDQVEDTHDRVLITRNGKPAAVLMSPEDLESLEETLELLSDAAAMKRIRKAQQEVKRGATLDAEQLRDLVTRSSRASS